MKRVALALALVLGACGGDDPETLTVSAASSLRAPVMEYAGRFDDARTRTSFGGSDELAAQIRQGARPDVFAAANTKLPEALFQEGLLEKPVVFARNRLVIAVPAGSRRVRSIEDLAEPGLDLAIGSESVPIGEYTRDLLDRLPRARSRAILANVRSTEPDVKGVVGKLTQGAVDAGVVYVTDVASADGKLAAVALPADLDESLPYAVAVVKGGRNPAAARAFVDGLAGGEGAQILREMGFEAP